MSTTLRPRLLGLVAAAVSAAAPAAHGDTATGHRPNVLVIVADDLGYTDIGAFGGEIATPNIDRLAYEGVRLAEFHVAATCSPTRAMLMTGTDHHLAGFANMAEVIAPEQRGKPGYEGYLTDGVVTIAELLQDAGYQTLMSGKWHLGAAPAQDPSRRGFERVFSLLEGGHNHFGRPNLPPPALGGVHYTENGKPVELPRQFYSSDTFTTRLLEFLEARDRSRPFFAYLPYTAPHWPLHAPAELIEPLHGRYDDGWEVLLETRLARLRALGLMPPNADLSAPPTMADWDSLDPAEQRRHARRMEVHAAMVGRMDWNIGRIVDFLRSTGQLDDTVILFFSDNGAAPDMAAKMLRQVADVELGEEPIESIGSIDSLDSYGPSWAQAATAPRRLYKSVVSEGGLTAPAFVRYPALKRQGTIDRTFATVMDIAPTLLELAGAAHPGNRYQARTVATLRGRSMLPYLEGRTSSIHEPGATFGWELFGQRALRRGHWKILYVSPPNGPGSWELFNLEQDPGERLDLSPAEPERFKEMLEAWEVYAKDMRIVHVEQVVSPYNAE